MTVDTGRGWMLAIEGSLAVLVTGMSGLVRVGRRRSACLSHCWLPRPFTESADYRGDRFAYLMREPRMPDSFLRSSSGG